MILVFFTRLARDIGRSAGSRRGDRLAATRDRRWSTARTDEIGGLIEAVNRMQVDLRRWEQQQEISRQQRFHQDKMAAVGSMAAAIGHEVSNPIAAIAGVAQFLIDETRDDDHRVSQLAHDFSVQILRQTERISLIMRQLATLTRPHSPEPELLDLNTLVQSTGSFISYDKRFRGIEFEFRLDHELPAVTAVADHMTQVLMNLFINAADAMEQTPKDGTARIVVSTAVVGSEIRLAVADTGHGMSPDVMARAFEESFTTKPAGRGRGIGLFLCKTLTEQAGGRIELESTMGAGTTVSLYLPPATAAETGGLTWHRCTYWSSTTRRRCDRSWRRRSARPAIRSNRPSGVREATAKLARGDFDVALCDIKMPDGTGIDLLRQCRATGLGTVFVMITASASMETAVEALRGGAYDYIVKPVRNEELLNRLAQIEAMRGLSEENKLLRAAVKRQGRRRVSASSSPCMLEVERLVNKVAPTNSTVLITGESGSGKGMLARTIHEKSLRSGGPFVPVNCGAIPEQLLESEFFGHTRGSFTGADRARKGLFVEADHGTLFLDEIGELPMPMQTKLLHVIEEKQVRAVGSEQAAARRHAHRRRDQPRPAGDGGAGRVPRGPVLPAEHVPDRVAAAARAARRHPRLHPLPAAERPRRIRGRRSRSTRTRRRSC